MTGNALLDLAARCRYAGRVLHLDWPPVSGGGLIGPRVGKSTMLKRSCLATIALARSALPRE